MKHREKILYFISINMAFLFIFSCITPLSLCAQSKKTKEDDKESVIDSKVRDEMQWMQQILGLSDAQYDKVNIVTYTYIRQSDSSENMRDMQVRKAFLTQCTKKKDADLKLILNADQYKTYLAKKDKKHTTARSPFVHSY